MEKSVSVITNALFEKLPRNLPFYSQDSLVQYGLPPFLVKRISQIVYLRILEKISLPDETWLHHESEAMTDAWHELTGAIKQELRIPSGIMKEVMKRSVRDCLELTVQPRRAIGKTLFGDDHELDVTTITERASSITVNRYLVWSLIRYMEKKKREKIDREQADRILEKIDEKVVENYHPLNWLALVKPLFELCGTTVPTDLLRLFFEDKKLNPAAKEFDLLEAEVNETRFIEVLSSPDLLYVEGYKDDQQTLFRESIEDDLEDPLHQKFMNSTEDLPEILPVEEETDIRDNINIEAETESDGEAELTAPWDEDRAQIGFESDEEMEEEAEKDDFLNQEDELLESSEPNLAEAEIDSEAESGSGQDDVEEQVEFKTEKISDREETVDTDVEPNPIEADPPQKKVTIESIEIDDDDEEDFDLEPDVVEDEVHRELGPASPEEEIEDEDIEKGEEEVPQGDETALTEDMDESLASRFMFDESTESEPEEDPDLDEATTIYDELNLSRKGAEPSTLDLFLNPEEVTFDTEEWTSHEPKEPVEHYEKDEEVDSEPDEKDEPEPDELTDSVKQTEKESPLFVDETEFKSMDEENMDEENDDLPMWRSFLEREDVENTPSFEFDNSRYDLTEDDEEDRIETENSRGEWTATPEDEEQDDDENESNLADVYADEDAELLDEDGFIEEPIYDLTKKETPIDQKIGDLNEWMLDEKEKFIEEIFGDSEDAYEQALADIIEFNDWKSASRYIEREIFTRNRIDVYDEIAVDFTDRLHSYFLEKK